MKAFNTKNTLLYAGIVMLPAILVILCLVIFSKDLQPHTGGFSRTFYKTSARQIKSITPPAAIRDIIDISATSLYFQTGDPALIYKADADLIAFQPIHLPLKQDGAVSSFFMTAVDSPFAYIAAGNIPMVIKTHFDTGTVEYMPVPEKTFSTCAWVSSNSLVFRMFKNITGKWDQIFVKADLTNKSTIEEKNISERNGDAGISADGQLQYEKTSGKLLYVHFYNNTVISMDTNLNLQYIMHTIDTNNTYTINVANYKSGLVTEYTNGNPIHDINVHSAVNNGLLFIQSNSKADNESREAFENMAVIDVYAINDKKYKGSFYIPDYHGKKQRAFTVYNNHFFALYSDRIICYQVPL